MRPAANPIEGCVVPFSSVPSSAPSSVSEFSFKILFKFPLDVAIQTDFPLDRTLPPRILLQPPRPPHWLRPLHQKRPARRKAFQNQNSKFLCPVQTTIILILVNLLVVIKSTPSESSRKHVLSLHRPKTKQHPEIKYRRKKEIAAAQNPFPADQSSKFSPGRGNELEIERD